MAIGRIFEMLQAVSGGTPQFPPTELYNEGWMSRLVLDWFSNHTIPGHRLTFASGTRWFSEALLPSAFAPRFKSDPLGEARTHTDGVIGHVRVGDVGRTDLSLAHGAAQLVVVEAKLFSNLAAGVAHAPYFDQAARNVACLVETLHRASRRTQGMSTLSFCVLAPQSKIKKGNIAKLMALESIHAKVAKRVGEYAGSKDAWFHDWFQPTLPFIDLVVLSWESLIEDVGRQDGTFAQDLSTFYRKALEFSGNPPASL